MDAQPLDTPVFCTLKSGKRVRVGACRDREDLWKACLVSPDELARCCSIMEHLFVEVEFRMTKQGLRVDMMSPDHVCCFRLVLAADVDANEDCDDRFVLDIKLLNRMLHGMHLSSECVLHISRSKEMDAPIRFARIDDADMSVYTIVTLEKEAESMPLKDMIFPITVNIDVDRLKRVVKTASDFHAEEIGISVEKTKGSEMRVFRVGFDDKTASVHNEGDVLLSTMQLSEDAGAFVDGGSPDGDWYQPDRMETLYEQRFPVPYLLNVVKGFEKTRVALHLGEGLPLMVQHTLGIDDRSDMRIVLAACGD